MARRRRRRGLRPASLFAAAGIALVILFANLLQNHALPGALQSAADAANSATGGLLVQSGGGSHPALSGLSVHFIDVGQGDSAFIWCDGESMLIDGGPTDAGDTAEAYVASYGISTLKYVVPTHPDEDHIAGLTYAIQKLSVQHIIMSDATSNTKTIEKLVDAIRTKGLTATRAVAGDTYTLGGATFTILGPVKTYSDTNDMSVVLRLQYKNRSFLFTGDAPVKAEKDMLAAGRDLQADVLKVGHHGSRTATSQAFLDAVSPKLAVISVGANNSYGLPDEDVLERLQTAGVQTLRTDESGTIVVQTDGDSLNVQTEKNT